MKEHSITCNHKVPEKLAEAVSAIKLGEESGNVTVSTPKNIEYVFTYSPDKERMLQALRIALAAADAKKTARGKEN